jgi:hypothetical protein
MLTPVVAQAEPSSNRVVLQGWVDVTGKEWRFSQPKAASMQAAPLPVGEAKAPQSK